MHFKLAFQISQAAHGFCILRNKNNHDLHILSNSSWSHKLLLYPNHHLCSRLKTFSLFIPLIQKPIHLCNHLCHASQHLTLLYTLSERQWPDLHMVFTTWGNRGFPQLKLWVLFSILCLIPSNAMFGFLTAALQFSWKHPQNYWNLLPRLQRSFFPPPQHCFVLTNTELPFYHKYHEILLQLFAVCSKFEYPE